MSGLQANASRISTDTRAEHSRPWSSFAYFFLTRQAPYIPYIPGKVI